METGGFSLWREVLAGNMKSWKKMCAYNKQDVVLLEKVYLKLRPYMTNHPNINIDLETTTPLCPACGSKKLTRRGYAHTNSSKYARLQCECGKWSRVRLNEISKEKKDSLVTGI